MGVESVLTTAVSSYCYPNVAGTTNLPVKWTQLQAMHDVQRVCKVRDDISLSVLSVFTGKTYLPMHLETSLSCEIVVPRRVQRPMKDRSGDWRGAAGVDAGQRQ